MKICSAPGKIYFFGEHAVVYGESAVACAIDLRTRVRVRVEGSGAFKFNILSTHRARSYSYVIKAIEKIDRIKKLSGKVEIEIESSIPVRAHLGSSAAVTVATLSALNAEFEAGLEMDEIARLGHEVEKEVQGSASPTDTFVSTFGGMVAIPERKRYRAVDVAIVVGNSGSPSSTGKMVARVKNLNSKYPVMTGGIIRAIGAVSRSGLPFIEKGDFEAAGRLMDINQHLLEALGVGTEELSAMCVAARKVGAYGAKLTGAGGGGCMVAISPKERLADVISALNSLGFKAFETRASDAGVMLE